MSQALIWFVACFKVGHVLGTWNYFGAYFDDFVALLPTGIRGVADAMQSMMPPSIGVAYG